MRHGKYIIIEGIDGSGKTTQLKHLIERLSERKIPFYKHIEPSEKPVGKFIRETILSGEYDTNELVRQMLFLTDRLDNFYNGRFALENLLREGDLIVADRSFLSGMVYGGEAGLKIHNQLFDYLILPDLIIYLDIPPEESIRRIDSGGGNKEIYETLEQQIEFKKRYESNLRRLEAINGVFVHNIDGTKSEKIIAELIWDIVWNFISISPDEMREYVSTIGL